MADLKIKQKKELAELLYTRNNLSQKEVAARVGVSEQAMSRWTREGKWDTIKTSLTITREEQLMNLHAQIAEINRNISRRHEGERLPNAKEADTINKLATAINKMERDTGLADIFDVSKKFLDWLRTFDLARAKEMSALFDAFIKDNLK